MWAKACGALGGSATGRSSRPPYGVCTQTQTKREREVGNALIGYVIEISMPDAEI